MTTEMEKLDPINRVACEVGGCKVRLFFLREPNENIERLVLDNLMSVFEQKMQGLANV